VRKDGVVLVHHPDVAPVRRHVVIRAPSNRISPLSCWLKPAMVRSSVVLPQPDGRATVKNSPGSTRELDIVERGDAR
jgi:hypothetical protein